jgi:hydroxymethylglutaryl-CoA lyase
MSDLPSQIEIVEEGPREGFQIEPGPVPTAHKIALIDTLAQTGLRHIQIASFVSARIVPGWADAEAVVAGVTPQPGVVMTALYFSEAGLTRALAFRDRLAIRGSISLAASDAFSRRNLNRDRAGQIVAMRQHLSAHAKAGVRVTRLSIQAAFGCNFEGDVAPERVLDSIADGLNLAAEGGIAGRTCDFLFICTTRGASALPTPMQACAWAWRVSIPPSAGWAAVPSPAMRVRPAILRPRSWHCSVRKWVLKPAST